MKAEREEKVAVPSCIFVNERLQTLLNGCTYRGWAVWAAAVDELVNAVGVIGETDGHSLLGERGVKGQVDEVLEVHRDLLGIGARHAGCCTRRQVGRGRDGTNGEEGDGGGDEAAHFD